jgi:hypothetical protein
MGVTRAQEKSLNKGSVDLEKVVFKSRKKCLVLPLPKQLDFFIFAALNN